MSSKFKLPGFVFQINNVKALGLQATQGVFGLMPFYWDQNDASRAFAKRFQELHPHKIMPNDMQAGVYSAMVHYLKAVAALKNAGDGQAVVAKMKELPTDDPLFGRGTIRIDGRKISSSLPLRDQEALRVQWRVGLFQTGHDDPRRAGFPSLIGRGLLARQGMSVVRR